jgi:uncharacterized protein
MPQRILTDWESEWSALIGERCTDSAHDLDHVIRVVSTAKAIAAAEGGRLEVIVPAAWLHDLIKLPKGDPESHLSSIKSASAACEFLRQSEYPPALLPEIMHCIEAHSFSAGIEPHSLEACIVQDADRLDALGAIGIARCFAMAGALNRALYDRADPFANHRELNDRLYAVDHFGAKLFRIAQTLRTATAQKLGEKRAVFMQDFLRQLRSELPAP